MIALTPAPSPDLRAEDIFARTRGAFAARAYPSTMKYGIRISGYRNGAWTGRTYDAFERWPQRSVVARSISEEEAANPYKPSMFAKSILENFAPPGAQSGGPQGPHILGFPELAVSYGFGLTPRATSTTASATTDTGLRTIGSVRAVARTYDVRLAGEESVDGNACWHLTLRPLGNPGTYRVRDLWVDERSYQTRKLVTDGNFTRKETGSGLWTVTYAQSGDAWYLDSEISQGPVDDDKGRYDHVAVQFVGAVADPHENLDSGSPVRAKTIWSSSPTIRCRVASGRLIRPVLYHPSFGAGSDATESGASARVADGARVSAERCGIINRGPSP